MWSKVIVCLLININQIVTAEYVGDVCVPNKHIAEGKCALITDCVAAIRQIKIKRGHDLKHCGYEDDIEIVCCPLTAADSRFGIASTERSTNALRIADRECRKIIDSAIPPLTTHILGGVATTLGEFPHMVALGFLKGNEYEFNCGGSVISKDYVLTAAHCVDNREEIEPTLVRAGIVELGGNEYDSETDFVIEEIIKHPNYTRSRKYNDIALLRLNKSLVFTSSLNAACLDTSDKDPTLPLVITGWGRISNTMNLKSKTLLKAFVSKMPSDKCSESYTADKWSKLPQSIIDSQLCAGDPKGIQDTCDGDSGGPLQSLNKDNVYQVVGITSFGSACGTRVPGVYTRVAKYIDWIERVVWTR